MNIDGIPTRTLRAYPEQRGIAIIAQSRPPSPGTPATTRHQPRMDLCPEAADNPAAFALAVRPARRRMFILLPEASPRPARCAPS